MEKNRGKATKAREKKGAKSDEQKKHLRRMARLERLLEVAEDTADEELKTKVNAMIEKENQRHARAVQKSARKSDGEVQDEK